MISEYRKKNKKLFKRCHLKLQAKIVKI